MAKITRKTAYIFAENAASNDVEQFASKQQTGTPNYTSDPAIIQALSAWGDGWSQALNPTNNSEYKQDRNGVDLVATYQIAYILQQGIAEWDSGTTYYEYSFVSYNGQIYISTANDNLNNTPGSSSQWQQMLFASSTAQPTRTVLTSGSGTYTPPSGCVRIYARLVGGGGGGAGNSGNGTAGGSTTLGNSLTAGGGSAGTTSAAGAGGSASGGSVNISGGAGAGGTANEIGPGGASAFGSGYVPGTNSGAGGGSIEAYGGGGGAYLEAIISNPSAMSYAVGAGGTGGSGSPGFGGVPGAAGIIIIEEYFY